MSIIRDVKEPRITEVSYDDARQRILMLDEELEQHKAQWETLMDSVTRIEYMIESCKKMRQIFIDDLESAGEEVYLKGDSEADISNLYPIQPGCEGCDGIQRNEE